MNLRKTVAAWGVIIACMVPTTAYGARTTPEMAGESEIPNVVHLASEAGLQSIFVPVSKNNRTNHFVSHVSGGIVIMESPEYRFMESAHQIMLDTPNEQEKLPESINGSHNAVWSTYLLPGGSVQHTLSLEYDGLWVSIVPKWTSELSKNGFTASEERRHLSLQELNKVVTTAKSLQRVSVQ